MNPLQQLQEDAVAYLLGNPATDAVPYQTFRQQAIDSAVKQALAGWTVRKKDEKNVALIGVACLVLMPSLFSQDVNVPGVQGSIELIIRTFEDPKVNNTGLSAEDVAMQNLKWFGDGLMIEGLTSVFPDKKGPALKPNYDYPGFLVYDTTLTGYLPQDYGGRTVMADVAEDTGTVTLSCTDAAAQIYFTVDGKMPTPGLAAQLYSAPFEVPPGTVIRVVAWNPDLLPSDVDQATINY
jgi:hypothetical protein